MIDWIKDGLDELVDGLLMGLVGGAALILGAVADIVIKIDGIINRKRLKEEMEKEGIKGALVEKADRCTNTVQIKDLETEKRYAVQGDGISDEITVGSYV